MSLSAIVHSEVIERAKEKVSTDNEFFKADVTAGLNPPAMASAIHWPLVSDAVGNAIGQQLTSVVEEPVDGNGKPYDPELYPEKYLPGRNRPTIGYRTMAASPPRVVIAAVDRRLKTAVSHLKGAERMAIAAEKVGLPISYNRQPFPTLQIGAAPAE